VSSWIRDATNENNTFHKKRENEMFYFFPRHPVNARFGED